MSSPLNLPSASIISNKHQEVGCRMHIMQKPLSHDIPQGNCLILSPWPLTLREWLCVDSRVALWQHHKIRSHPSNVVTQANSITEHKQLFPNRQREDRKPFGQIPGLVAQRAGDRYKGTALFKHLTQHPPPSFPSPCLSPLYPTASLLSHSLPFSLHTPPHTHTHTHTPASCSNPIFQTTLLFLFFTVPAACWGGSSIFVGEVSVCSGCSAGAPVRPTAAPLGRHCTLLLWRSVAEAPLLRAGAPAVCNASTVVGGAKLARLTALTTEPRLSLPPPSEGKTMRKRWWQKRGTGS